MACFEHYILQLQVSVADAFVVEIRHGREYLRNNPCHADFVCFVNRHAVVLSVQKVAKRAAAASTSRTATMMIPPTGATAAMETRACGKRM